MTVESFRADMVMYVTGPWQRNSSWELFFADIGEHLMSVIPPKAEVV